MGSNGLYSTRVLGTAVYGAVCTTMLEDGAMPCRLTDHRLFSMGRKNFVLPMQAMAGRAIANKATLLI